MSEECACQKKDLLILEPNSIEQQKKIRYEELKRRGIAEPELTRAVNAEFMDPTPPFEKWPGPVTGLDNAGDIDLDLIFSSKTPPLVLPQEEYGGPFDVSNINPYPNNPTPDGNNDGIKSNTYNFKNTPAIKSLNWEGLASKENSEPPTSGVEGFNSEKEIPEWRYPVEDSQMYPSKPLDITLPSGEVSETEKTEKSSVLKKLLPWLGILGGAAALDKLLGDYMAEAPEEPEKRNKYFTHTLPTIHAKFTLSSKHKEVDVCDDYAGEIFDLTDKNNRPILPTEGLGYSNLTHPHCQCTWVLQKADTLIDSLTRKQQSEFDSISLHIENAAKDHTLHTVKADGMLSSRTRGTNPILETIGNVRKQFNWLDEEYLTNAKNIARQRGAKLYLIRAATEAITDHRAEGEKHKRKLAGSELQGMARTAIGKVMDINHDPRYITDAIILDSEYNETRKEIQMMVMEQDDTINNAIKDGNITAVSINGGAPRKQTVKKCDDNCTGGCELCNVPEGIILGDNKEGVAMTWVVTNTRGIFWRGQHIPAAEPGIKTTVIEILY